MVCELLDQFPCRKASFSTLYSSGFSHHCLCAQAVGLQLLTICDMVIWTELSYQKKEVWNGMVWPFISKVIVFVPVTHNGVKFDNGLLFCVRELAVL